MPIVPTTIDLLGACTAEHCVEMARGLHDQLSNGYMQGASIQSVPPNVEMYLEQHRTTRKRAARAVGLGYGFAHIDRQAYEDDVFEINTSASDRQGRPMSAGYLEPPRFGRDPLRCVRHHVYTYGVIANDGRLSAYLWLYRSGELAMVSSILGHADALRDDVMYLLFRNVVREQAHLGGTFFYNLHCSGTDGLRFFKERLGFEPGDVRWTA